MISITIFRNAGQRTELLKIKRDYANQQETYQKLMEERDTAAFNRA